MKTTPSRLLVRSTATLAVTGVLAVTAFTQSHAQNSDRSAAERTAPLAIRNELQAQRNTIAARHLNFTVGVTPATGKSYLNGLVAPDAGKFQAAYARQQATTKTTTVTTTTPTVKATTSTPTFNYTSILGAVRNQLQCGSCWTFGSTAAFEGAYVLKHGGTWPVLSEQQMLSCSAPGSYTCNGGWYDAPFNYMIKHGQTTDAAYPYTATATACKNVTTNLDFASSWGYVKNTSGVCAVNDIKQALLTYGPLTSTVCADGYFMNYTGGVFSNTTNGQINHCICIVGWDDTAATGGGGSWLVRNSWSAQWGEKGYIRIKYGANSIGNYSAYIVAK